MPTSFLPFLRRWELHAPITAIVGNRRGDWAAFAIASGGIVLLPTEDAGEAPLFLDAHTGPIAALAQDSDDHAFLSGGTDGRLLILEPDVPAPTPLAEDKKRSLIVLDAAPNGLRAYADSESLSFLGVDGEPLTGPPIPVQKPSLLRFSPDGQKLVSCDEGGWRLFALSEDKRPKETLAKAEKIRAALWSSDGATIYLLTAENHLQFWFCPEKSLPGLVGVLPLGPFFEETVSLVLSAEGRVLVVSGRSQALALPLSGPAPWQNAPFWLGEKEQAEISCFVTNPKENMGAIGYKNGAVVLTPFDGRREIPIFPPVAPSGAGVVGLVWSARGESFLVGLENGHVFLFTQRSVKRFVTRRV